MNDFRSGWPPKIDDLRVVIGDVHGDWEVAWRLLKKTDVVDKLGRKKPHRHVTFLGDIGHWGHNVYGGDYYALLLADKYGDALIGGNHEGPLALNLPRFKGALARHMIAPEALRLLDRITAQGRWQAAVAIDGWLLTHAGLHPTYQERLRAFIKNPEALADEINRLFYQRLVTHRKDPLFDSSGPIRGNDAEPGGVFWMDARELIGGPWRKSDGSLAYPPLFDFNRVRQIVGHTASISGSANPAPMFYGDSFIVNDVGAGLTGRGSALVKRAHSETWTPVVSVLRPKGGSALDIGESPEFIRAHHPILETILNS